MDLYMRYSISDLVLEASIEFPELLPSSEPPNLCFELLEEPPAGGAAGAVYHQWKFEDGELWCTFRKLENCFILDFSELAEFTISQDAQRVQCRRFDDVSTDTVRHLFLNQVMPLIQNLKGAFVLHASAVEVDGRAVLFTGVAGAGKSTLAMAFAQQGYAFLADDSVKLEFKDESVYVAPGFPALRLFPETIAVSKVSGRQLGAVNYNVKLRILASETLPHCNRPLSLASLYVVSLYKNTEFCIYTLAGQKLVVELIQNSFLLETQSSSAVLKHFDSVTKLASKATHFELHGPLGLEHLPATVDAIVAHQRSLRA